MAHRPSISKQRLDEYRLQSVRSAGGLQSWQQFRSALRSSDLPLRPALSPARSQAKTSVLLGNGRGQSPLQRYRSNPDLFYQTLGSKNRPGSPSAASYSSALSSGLLRTRRDGNVTTAVLKRRLNDILKLEDLLKAQELASELTTEEVSKLPPKYVEELRKTLSVLGRQLGLA